MSSLIGESITKEAAKKAANNPGVVLRLDKFEILHSTLGLINKAKTPSHAVEVMRRVVDRMLLISEREIAQAIGALSLAGIRVEGAAAAALAALPRLEELPGPIVLVVTGRNIDEETHQAAVTRPESFPD